MSLGTIIGSAQPASNFADLSSAIAVIAAAAAVVSTAVLSVIAIRFSSGFLVFESRVRKIERWMDQERNEQFSAMRAASEMLRRVLDNSYKIDMAIAEFLKLELAGAPANAEKAAHRMQVFSSEVHRRNLEAQRYLAYLAILKEGDPDRVFIAIVTACRKYPDETSIAFLEAVRALLPPHGQEQLAEQVEMLKMRVRGVDAVRWTG